MLLHQHSYYRFSRMVVSIVLISQLLACNLDNNNNNGSSGGNLTPDAVVNVDLNGSVGDGPIIGATVAIYSDSGELLSSVNSDIAASYRLKIKAKGYDYPLLLKVSGGTDLVTGNEPDFQFLSVVLDPSEKSVNINPFSTLVVKMAQSMGGVNAATVSEAKTIVTDSFSFGLDPSVVSDPITAQITKSNVANLVKASEVLGEMVRRTRDALVTAGTAVSGDAVMAAIAADLIDGVLDGSGASDVQPTISAAAKVVSAQVLVEALSNNLKVNGVVATEVMDQSIAVTHGVGPSRQTDSVRITSGMLEQTLIALTALEILDSGVVVQNIVSVVESITPDASPAELVTVLPADASSGLDHAVTLAPYASTEDIDAINKVVVFTGSVDTTTGGAAGDGTTTGGAAGDGTTSGGTTGTSDPVINSVPVISGTPASSVVANTSYSFQPVATDADATDSLNFSISGMPDWANFNNKTGLLAGTPVTGNVGTYSNIVISVSDGTASVSLPAFSIQVQAEPVQTSSLTLQWTAPVTRADGTPLSLADIDGYRIYYGDSAGNYPNLLEVSDGTAQSATITDIPAGTYYIVMTTYDVGGLESAYSTMVVKTAP